MPKVSVIIPTYNRARYVCEAIDSVLSQTFTDYEIIVVDDGSTDDTKEALNKYGDRIRYLYQENKGEAAARNKGIQEAKGEYIAFLDSDDFWLEKKLELQVVLLDSKEDIVLTYCSAKRINEQGKELDIKPTKPALKPEDFFKGASVPMTVLFRRSSLDNVGCFDEKMRIAEDADMWLRVCLKHKIHFMATQLAIIRTHSTNISNSETGGCHGAVQILNKLLNDEVENKMDKAFLKTELAYKYYCLGRIYYKHGNTVLALKYSLMAIKTDPFVGKCFVEKGQSAFSRIKRYLNPYGLLGMSILKRHIKKETGNEGCTYSR